MYITKNSGHHRASQAVENAFHELSDDVETLNINSFQYTNPILEKVINKTYMSVIRRKPAFWGYLYDNPRIVERTQRLRESIHKYNSSKMKKLLQSFNPDAVLCTQAFPCGIVADYKKTYSSSVVLAGILTDYAPHSYWIYEHVDFYFVPSEEVKDRLVSNGVPAHKIKITGIPIDAKFRKIIDKAKIRDSLNFSADTPVILIMGGSQGMGPVKEIVKILDGMPIPLQIIVVTGDNTRLYRYLKRRLLRYRKKLALFSYAEDVDELMEISSLIVSKPGGMTISEAMAKGLPLLIVKPIPGQEAMNTSFLVRNKVAIKIERLHELDTFVSELLTHPSALNTMRERVKAFSRPNSAIDIAKSILERIM